MKTTIKALLILCIGLILGSMIYVRSTSNSVVNVTSEGTTEGEVTPARPKLATAHDSPRISGIEAERKNPYRAPAQLANPGLTSTNPPLVKELITAESAYVVLYNPALDSHEVIYSKAPTKRFPIASISKLITLLATEFSLTPTTTITITKEAVGQWSKDTIFQEGQEWTVEELIPFALISSHNVASYALATNIGTERFLETMNGLSREIGMSSTHFVNPTGLDDTVNSNNYSTAIDIVTLAEYLIFHNNPILALSTTPSKEVNIKNGSTTVLINTNRSLSDTRIPWKIIGGKTGYTGAAKETLLLMTESPYPGRYVIAVILHSDNRTEDMAALMGWVAREGFKSIIIAPRISTSSVPVTPAQ